MKKIINKKIITFINFDDSFEVGDNIYNFMYNLPSDIKCSKNLTWNVNKRNIRFNNGYLKFFDNDYKYYKIIFRKKL